ncbi:kinesin-like protein KIN-14S [Lactuca sativa]|uniref:Kinesin-like protein n=1 Tax=Lactuca sativa TaxID=4236 RepID=A0A9R1UCA4_LACSA|nr:kinesin-like protein KIN-14S [Lactuca sativa]KAJ0184485.1 hypothetical protein LSAT_V11C900490540 [Lactuca sativa]
MADKTRELETITMSMKLLKLDPDQTIEGSPDYISETVECNGGECNSDMHSDQEQRTLPIFEKFDKLSNKVKNLRKEHTALCNEVKNITADSFPGSEVFTALQNLGEEHENLKKKYQEECQTLKNRFHLECSERRRLYNEVIELKGNIRVFCRCRPLNHDEITKGSTSVVDFESVQENELKIIGSDSSKKQFKFDHIFKPEDNQEAVFTQTLPLVVSVLDGFNVCIFAYGQTGTGKTFTMEGTPEHRGVNYRTLEQLFKESEKRSDIMRYELFVSMLEVYNEKIRDLLVEETEHPSKKLEIKQSAEGTQEVPGLSEVAVYKTDEVWELLKSGSRVRSVGSTNANELSSRSHCLLRVTVRGENLVNGQRTRSHLWLVDLAGSERVGKIEVEGERLKESQFINKSLSALGDVISALASKTSHIPYRNSKLTHILQSSLGGDCKTLMFVQISPSSSDLGETICSLNFASRVRGVEHGPARKQTDVTELFKYKQLAEKAKHDEKETKKLQDNLQSVQLRLSAREHICRTLQEKVRDLESQLAEERKARQKQENRALAVVSSSQSSLKQSLTTISEKRPPLIPSTSKLRLPLRRITNFVSTHPPSSATSKLKSNYSSLLSDEKENLSKPPQTTKPLSRARRGSIASKPTPAANQVLKPKRRASIAAFHSESSNTPVAGTTGGGGSRLRDDGNRVVARQSFVWDRQRVLRTSRVESPLDKEAAVEGTPVAAAPRRFMGSPPPSQAVGSWKPKHPTVVALQRKQLVWSPLKYRGTKAVRKSFV